MPLAPKPTGAALVEERRDGWPYNLQPTCPGRTTYPVGLTRMAQTPLWPTCVQSSRGVGQRGLLGHVHGAQAAGGFKSHSGWKVGRCRRIRTCGMMAPCFWAHNHIWRNQHRTLQGPCGWHLAQKQGAVLEQSDRLPSKCPNRISICNIVLDKNNLVPHLRKGDIFKITMNE